MTTAEPVPGEVARLAAGDPPAAAPARLRIRFTKAGKVRFTSHRDVARIWERALRRAGVPVAYSEGFSPRPRISFGLALPTCYESDGEYLDVAIDPRRVTPGFDNANPQGPHQDLADALSAALPQGMAVAAVAGIDRKSASLQEAVASCTWRIETAGADQAGAKRAVQQVLASETLPIKRQRKGRCVTEDIRPAVLSLSIDGQSADGVTLIAELGTQPRAARPADLLACMDPPLTALRVRRLHQWTATDPEHRQEPLAAAANPVASPGATP